MPTLDRELELTQASFRSLGLDQDILQFTQHQWPHASGDWDVIHALLLSPGTPAPSPIDLAIGLDWGKNRVGQLTFPLRRGFSCCDDRCVGS